MPTGDFPNGRSGIGLYVNAGNDTVEIGIMTTTQLNAPTLKDQLITELRRLKPVVTSAPSNYAAVMRAGKIVATLRDEWQVSDEEMKAILKRKRR